MTLTASKCRLHPDREAVARCVGCETLYCRECVAEHDGRMLCSACLAQAPEVNRLQKQSSSWLIVLLCFLSLAVFYFTLIGVAKLISNHPDSFQQIIRAE